MRKKLAFLACVVLVAGCNADSGNELSRDHVIAEYRALFKSWDKDRDGRLSPSESRAMVDNLIEVEGRHMPSATRTQMEAQRIRLIRDIASQDLDRDGYLTLNDLLARPLAIFDCTDRDHDGSLSETEISSRMERCTSLEDHKRLNVRPQNRTLAMPLETMTTRTS